MGSAIFYHDEEQKELALKTFDEAKKQRNRPIATEIAPATEFTDAENYHQKYLLQHHPWLMESLEIHPGDHLIKSHVAARLNGYIGGYGNVKEILISCHKQDDQKNQFLIFISYEELRSKMLYHWTYSEDILFIESFSYGDQEMIFLVSL